MKNVLLAILLIGPFFVSAQDCAAVITNLDCDGTNISFDLTLTADGVPLTLNGSNGIAIGTDQSETSLYAATTITRQENFTADFNNYAMDGFSVAPTFQNGNDCDDFSGQLYLTLDINYDRGRDMTACASLPIPVSIQERSSESLPSFGQWGLILFGLGIMSLAVFILVRNGKEISI